MINSPVDCGNPQLTNITKSSGRSISKGWLRPIKRDGKLFCAWCNQKELTKFRSKYCSVDCLETSSAYCYPQSNPQSFFFLFKRQNNQCADCKFDYSSTLEALKKEKLNNTKKRISRKIDLLKEMPLEEARKFKKTIQGEIRKFNNHLLAQFLFDIRTPKKIRKHHRKLKDQREPEVDHLVPIGAGGSALGFENLQLLCFKCHKAKTAQDIVKIRALKRVSNG
jgi:HNH endonuclease